MKNKQEISLKDITKSIKERSSLQESKRRDQINRLCSVIGQSKKHNRIAERDSANILKNILESGSLGTKRIIKEPKSIMKKMGETSKALLYVIALALIASGVAIHYGYIENPKVIEAVHAVQQIYKFTDVKEAARHMDDVLPDKQSQSVIEEKINNEKKIDEIINRISSEFEEKNTKAQLAQEEVNDIIKILEKGGNIKIANKESLALLKSLKNHLDTAQNKLPTVQLKEAQELLQLIKEQEPQMKENHKKTSLDKKVYVVSALIM